MIKPSKKWVVDGEIFETYGEACAHIRKHKTMIRRDTLVADLREAIMECHYGRTTEDSAESVADALLALYEMKRKR